MIRRNLAEAIGNTPLIRLRRASEETGCEILGKAEFLNPGQSVKDRAALFIIRDAVARGDLKPGGTIVEGTAGNTGIGLALVGASMGFRTVIVIPETQSQEKKDMLRLAGAELVEVPAVPYKEINNYIRYSGRLAEELARTEPNGAIWANQFDNTANRQAHIETTGPEIWSQTGGKIDGFTCAVGSGGTLAGVAAALQPRGVKVALADPEGPGCSSSIPGRRTPAIRSPRGSVRAASPRTSMASPPTWPIASPMPRRCRWSSICCNTRGSAWVARPGSMSPGRSAWRVRWGRAIPSSPCSAITAPVISPSCSTPPS
jgi:Cysteine synthase